MKFLSIALVLTCLSINSIAQDTTTTSADNAKKPYRSRIFDYPKNVVKMNITSLALNNYSFFYERMIARKISVTGGLRFMPTTKLSKTMVGKELIKAADLDQDDKDEVERLEASNTSITAGIRFYTGKRAGAKGLYAEVYGRFTNFKAKYAYDYTSKGKDYRFPIALDAKGIGGGVLFGGQFNLAKQLVVDLYIIGAHYGKLSGDLDAITDLSGMDAQERQNMQNDINDLGPSFNDKKVLKATVSSTGVQGKVDGPFIGARGLGLSLGWTF